MLTKVGIIGVGNVGSHVASMLSSRGICDEIILIDVNSKKLKGHTLDLADMELCFSKGCKIREGTYTDLKDADIVVISASGNIFDENRLEELGESMEIIDNIAPQIEASEFSGIALVITNPCDLITYYLSTKISATVIGSGTLLDTARFRHRIANALNVDIKSVEGYCLGEHGNSQVSIWSSVRIGGRSLESVLEENSDSKYTFDHNQIEKSTIFAGWEIADAKGSTEFAIGIVASELIRAILCDEKRILPCSAYLNGEYGEKGLYIGVPCLIGAKGVEKIWEIPLTEDEKNSFHQSCQLLKNYISKKM